MNNESFWWKNMGSLQTGIDPNIWRDQRETCASQKNCIFWGCWKGRPLFSIYQFYTSQFPSDSISWSARSAAAVGSPADAYLGLTVTTLVLCGPTLLAGCYLLQLIFEPMAEKYVTILQLCNFWHLDGDLETDGLLDENKYRSFWLCPIFPFFDCLILGLFGSWWKERRADHMTWSFVHNLLFCCICNRNEWLWVGKLLAHETGSAQLLKQAALVELA